jgi:hypothetical protein
MPNAVMPSGNHMPFHSERNPSGIYKAYSTHDVTTVNYNQVGNVTYRHVRIFTYWTLVRWSYHFSHCGPTSFYYPQLNIFFFQDERRYWLSKQTTRKLKPQHASFLCPETTTTITHFPRIPNLIVSFPLS